MVPGPQQVLNKYCYFHPMTTHLGNFKKSGGGKSRVCFAFPIKLFLAKLFLETLILLQAINRILSPQMQCSNPVFTKTILHT